MSNRHSKSLLAVFCLLVVIFGGCKKEPQPGRKTAAPAPALDGPTPNIIFVLIDALRADRLGVYGHPRKLTPTLDSIAAEGVLFERAIAPAPWTQPAIASLFCGCYPGVHQVVDFQLASDAANYNIPKTKVFRDSFDTLAEALRRRGYVNAAFVANPFILSEHGFAQGFDHFDAGFTGNMTAGSVVNAAAIAWVEQQDRTKPFFVYLHYMDVHGPYNAAPELVDPLIDEVEAMPDKHLLTQQDISRLRYLGAVPQGDANRRRHDRLAQYREYWAARYEGGAREVDVHIADLRSRLQTMGLWDDAYVIVTADHGEALCEHGHWDHGFSTHHPELHVPLILRWPAVLPAGARVTDSAQLIDVFPTLVDQLGLAAVGGVQGRSLLPSIVGEMSSVPVPAFAEGVKKGPEQKALYLGDWKLILDTKSDTMTLYNIAEDPLEQRDLAAKSPVQVEFLAGLVQQQLERNRRLAAHRPVEEVPISPEQLDRLKSLGYVE